MKSRWQSILLYFVKPASQSTCNFFLVNKCFLQREMNSLLMSAPLQICTAFLCSTLYILLILELNVRKTIFDKDKAVSSERLAFSSEALSFRYVILPNITKCRSSAVKAVVVVLSRAGNGKIRSAIRESWASERNSQVIQGRCELCYYSTAHPFFAVVPSDFIDVELLLAIGQNGTTIVYFIVSSPKYNFELDSLAAEKRLYNDIIALDITESYGNLILKVYATLMFYRQHCEQVAHLIKVDDDVVLLLDKILSIRKNVDENVIYCQLWNNHAPSRNPISKWYVPRSSWPQDVYPDYCDGPAYIIGRKAAKKLLDATPKLRRFYFEDVFFTGIAADFAGVARRNWSDVMIFTDRYYWRARDECSIANTSEVVAVHSLPSPESLKSGFKKALRFKCENIKRYVMHYWN
ncbi:unnamed protein product [Cylicocyclus nassatus]|uniref:Hexosyltransferase n=1 Tax=Cylicocyclus nassatus TaxID=53992 RepID=A0AA36GER5_CYLNA|nr:unnamed protein product [Cylicocyclus nassatus]